MTQPSEPPRGGLGAQLLDAARSEEPSAASLARAHATIERAPAMLPAKRRRLGVWLLAAAALGAVAVLVSLGRWRSERPLSAQPSALPSATAAPVVAATAAAAGPSAYAANPAPAASASASASAVASVMASAASSVASPPPSAVKVLAVRPSPRPAPRPRPAAAPKPSPPSSARPNPCGCAPSDLMCFMRCKGKK